MCLFIRKSGATVTRNTDGVWDWALPLLSLLLVAAGLFLGLFLAPPDRQMGEVYRILYVHVPAAWLTLVAYSVTLLASMVYLWRNDLRADALAGASAEVGVVLNVILLVTGSIWGKPTWGVWWTWDPRLTTAAIMCCAFAGYLALRAFVDDSLRRATWAALVAMVIYVDIPFVWFSVKWNTLHQLQSSPETVAAPMVLALRVNAFAFLALYLWLTRLRYQGARLQQGMELTEPPAAVPL
jgi:heme exporter protein C